MHEICKQVGGGGGGDIFRILSAICIFLQISISFDVSREIDLCASQPAQ